MKSIFDYYPESIFSPLSNKNKRIYWKVIEDLFHVFFDDSIEITHSTLAPKVIRSQIELTLSQVSDVYESEDDETDSDRSIESISTQAQQIYSKLKDTGWLKIEKEGVILGVYMSPRIINLIDFFIHAQANTSENVGVSVITIYQALASLSASDNYTAQDIESSLTGALEQSKKMQRQMTNLSAEMLDVHEKIGEVNDLSEKTELFFNEFINSAAFESLKSIKGSNHPYRFKSEILELIDKLEYTTLNTTIIDKLSNDNPEDREFIKERFHSKLWLIRRIFNNTTPLLDRIDRHHNKLVKRTSEAIRYQQRHSTKSTEVFTTALASIKGIEPDQDNQFDIISPYLESLSDGYADINFTMTKHKKPPIQTKAIRKPKKFSVKKQLETQLYRDFRRRLSNSESLYMAWLDEQFITLKSTEISSEEITVKTIEDTIFFTLSRRLCNPSHQNKTKYKQTQERYAFELISGDMQTHETSICRPFLLIKKEC